MPEEPKTKFDAFIAKVVGDPAKPQETLMLKGFLGASSEPNHTRIYTDPTLEDYVDVASGDIVHTEPIAKEESPLGGYYVWVKKAAEVLTGKAGSERRKAKFLEGPIAAQAGAAGPVGPGPVPGVTVPLIACHPTLIVQFCRTHIPPLCPPPSPFPWQCGITHFPPFCPPPSPLHFCPPSPLHHCPPSPPPLFCPQTPLCPTLPAGCPPPLTVNQPQCVASGGGPACPVDTPQTPQTPQLGGGGVGHAMGMAEAAAAPHLQPSILWACHPSVPVWQCQPIHSVFLPCPSVPIWHCPTAPIVCQPSAFIACQTIVQPHCLPVVTAACPIVTAACPQGPVPAPGGMGLAAAAAPPIPQSLAAPCLTVAATSCGCPTHFPALCPTPLCPSQHGFHCPTIHQFHCPSVLHWHCPTPACPTPQCPTAVCTDIGPHCNPTPNPVHCPTPNMMCPTPTASFQCPSVGEICPTSSPLFCAAGPGAGQAGMAPQAAAAPQIQVHPTLTLQCRPSIFCPVTFYPAFCPVTLQPWCHPRTLSGVQCFTPFCPIVSAVCPPQQSLACGPGGFGGGFPGF